MRRASLLGLAVLALAATPALAEPTASELVLARRLFDEARAAESERQWDRAIAKLRDALTIKETAGLRFHLGFCEEQRGHLVQALVEYDRAADAVAKEKAGDVERQLEPRRVALRARVPTVAITLRAAPPGAHVEIDGHAIAPALVGQPIPEDPGAHRIVVSAPGHADFARDVRLAEAETAVVSAELVPAQVGPAPSSAASPPPAVSAPVGAPRASAPSPPSSPSPHGAAARTWVLASEGALVVAGLALGVVEARSASGADARAEDARAAIDARTGKSGVGCADGGAAAGVAPSCADLATATDDARRARTWETAGFVAAGAGAAAFVATWLLWPRAGASAPVALVPTLAPGEPAGLRLSLRF